VMLVDPFVARNICSRSEIFRFDSRAKVLNHPIDHPFNNCADRKFFAIHIPTAPSPTTTLIPVNKALLQSAFIKSLTFVFYPFIRSSPLPPGSILRLSLSSEFRRSRGTCFHITPLSQKQQFRGSPRGFLLLLVFVVCCII
jgi:hypothetical protein